MNQDTFEFTKRLILKNMPSGLIATKSPIMYDIGLWRNEVYKQNEDITSILSVKCSKTINIFGWDESATQDNILAFITDNRFEKKIRHFYFIYTYIFPKTILTDIIRNELSNNALMIDTFGIEISVDGYVIFVNNFIRNMLLL